MNIPLSSEHEAMLAAEAARRNDAAIDALSANWSAETLALQLLASAAESYHRTADEAYARSLYARIQVADTATRHSIFAAAERALS